MKARANRSISEFFIHQQFWGIKDISHRIVNSKRYRERNIVCKFTYIVKLNRKIIVVAFFPNDLLRLSVVYGSYVVLMAMNKSKA